MNITNYIVEFLKQGNTVEIKGIGTFSPKTISTRFDEETKTYFPTVNTVEFSTVCLIICSQLKRYSIKRISVSVLFKFELFRKAFIDRQGFRAFKQLTFK